MSDIINPRDLDPNHLNVFDMSGVKLGKLAIISD